MKYFLLTALLLIMLTACSGEDMPLVETPEPFGTTSTVEATVSEATNTPESPPTPTTPPPPTREDSTSPRFKELRFASSPDGEPHAIFSLQTQEVYALWQYEGMAAGDSMRRIWYLNDSLYIEKSEAWDIATYGASGTRRDVLLYDYIDGIDAGQWRVEIYLNGVPEIVGTFTVQ